MARARNIKPSYFTNDILAECPPLARILFSGLWCHADRAGRLEDRPKKIKAEILPYDDADVDEFLRQLDELGFILRYEAGGKRYIQILAFAKHQNPHVKEAESTIPAPGENSSSTVQAGKAEQPSTELAGLIPDSLNPITDSLSSDTKASPEYSDEFEQAWREYPSRPGANKKTAFKAWNARLKDVDPETLLAGVRRYAAYVIGNRIEPNYVKLPATFFGPDEHFKADWTVQARASPQPYESAKDRARRETNEALTGKRHEQHQTVIDIIDV